ncbi:MAG TPA: hypothetical protein VMW72_23630 [Sedimentisphaerales bacterium]|nr:hypothetical protein [Sedimentisphaerales bacterium]
MKPRTNRFDREAAFSMDLVNPDSDTPDAINCAATLNGSSICFLENSIAKTVSAETADPENKEPDTRHSYQFIYQIGSTNPIVARTILQVKSILGSVILRKGLSNQTILDHAWDCTQHLISCEDSFLSIYNETTDLMYKCDELINEAKYKSHIPSLPQVKNLTERIVTFLGNGKRFLEKSHELLCIFYGAANNDSNFQAYRDWMKKHEPSRVAVYDLLEQNKDWIKSLAWYRNALDINHARAGFRVTIENFKLQAGNKFTGPCWQYDFQDKGGDIQNSPSDLIVDINAFRANMLAFFEALSLTCIKDNWDSQWNFEIYRHEDERINPKCPIIFFVGLNHE